MFCKMNETIRRLRAGGAGGAQGRSYGGGGGGLGARAPPPTNSRCLPGAPHKKLCVYIFEFANIARELILSAPTKIMLI